jgi:hypothetical protein
VDSAVIMIANSPPSIASVSISPASGDETTTFTCIPAGWNDTDGDAENYRFQWMVGANAVATTATLTGTLFNRDDVISCAATPNDGFVDGAAMSSQPLTVQNAVPSIASVTITPTNPQEGAVMTANILGWSDADGDAPGYRYAW